MNIEVVTLVFHLVVTLSFVIGYLYTVAIGHPDETFRNLSLLSGGYWFGAVGGSKAVETVKGIFQKKEEAPKEQPTTTKEGDGQ